MWHEPVWPWWHVTWGHFSSTFFWGQCELLTQKKFLPWAPSQWEVDMWFYHSCKLKAVWPSPELKKVQFAAAKAQGSLVILPQCLRVPVPPSQSQDWAGAFRFLVQIPCPQFCEFPLFPSTESHSLLELSTVHFWRKVVEVLGCRSLSWQGHHGL